MPTDEEKTDQKDTVPIVEADDGGGVHHSDQDDEAGDDADDEDVEDDDEDVEWNLRLAFVLGEHSK